MQLVGAALHDGVNHGSGGAPVLGRIPGGEYREFLNGIDAQIDSGRSAGRGVRIIVDRNTVDPVVILVGAMAGTRQLISEAPIAFVRAEARRGLVGNAQYARFQGCKRRPVAPVQREFAHRLRIHCCAHGGRLRLNGIGKRLHFHTLAACAHFQREIKGLLRADSKLHALFNGLLESRSRGRYLIVARQQVGRGIEPLAVGGNVAGLTRRRVADGNCRSCDGRAGWIFHNAGECRSRNLRAQRPHNEWRYKRSQ